MYHQNLPHIHHRLHMRLKEFGYNGIVKLTISGSLELLLIDIAVGIADRCWNKSGRLW